MSACLTCKNVFWHATTVAIAKKFGFAGWSLDVEPTVSPPGSGGGTLTNYSRFLATLSSRLAAHGLRLSTAEPNGNLINTSVPWHGPPAKNPVVSDYSGYFALGHSGAEVTTMDTYYGVMPLSLPHHLENGIKAWQKVVPPATLTVGFGALFAAWGVKSCDLDQPAGVNQTGCLKKSLAACTAMGVDSIAIFQFDVWGCGKTASWPSCQIAGSWPPDAWWPLLHDFAVGD